MTTVPFDVDLALARIEQAVRPFPKAAMFALADEGFRSPFEQLAACMISIRTRDETTLPIARRLFARARTPAALAALEEGELARLLDGATFSRPKSAQLREIARRLLAEHDGALPCDAELLLALPGIGPKCANLVLGIACGQARIGVDVHVHRVTNRWGYARAATPEQTMAELEARLPRRYWVTINRLLVPFGKHICTGALPHCSTCPVRDMCRRVGVTRHR